MRTYAAKWTGKSRTARPCKPRAAPHIALHRTSHIAHCIALIPPHIESHDSHHIAAYAHPDDGLWQLPQIHVTQMKLLQALPLVHTAHTDQCAHTHQRTGCWPDPRHPRSARMRTVRCRTQTSALQLRHTCPEDKTRMSQTHRWSTGQRDTGVRWAWWTPLDSSTLPRRDPRKRSRSPRHLPIVLVHTIRCSRCLTETAQQDSKQLRHFHRKTPAASRGQVGTAQRTVCAHSVLQYTSGRTRTTECTNGPQQEQLAQM